MNLQVRPSTKDDAVALAEIYGPAVRNGLASFEYEPPDAAEMASRREAIVVAGYPYLVAERDGLVIAYAYASAYRTRPGYRHVVENSVYVRPGHGGAGTGSVLMDYLIADCEAKGFRQMIAVIGDLGNTASIALRALRSSACCRRSVGSTADGSTAC